MRKITLYLILLLSIAFTGYSQVQVGSGTNMDQRVPIETYYGYTYSQSIYLASEINASGTITSIQWYFNGSNALANSQEVVVYLGTTSKSVFASDTDWEPETSLTPVYAGGITGGAPGWVTITFDTGFVYDGTSNLVVAVEENMPGYDDNGPEGFYNFQVNGTRSLCYYSDSNNPTPANPPQANFTSDYVPNIIFDGITQACPTPFNIVASNIGTTSATLTWDPSASVPSAGSQYYTSTSNTPPTASTTPSGSVASGETADITSGLNPATTYYVWVRNNCGSGLYSAWSSFSKFTTACVAITDFNENFDGAVTPALPTCWTSLLRGDSLSEYAAVETTTESVHSDPNAVRIYNSDTDLTTNDVILVSPNLSNIGAGTHRIKFYAKGAGNLQVGTLDGNSDTAVFTSYQDIETTDGSHEYTVDFSGYSGTDNYIGFRLSTPFTYNTIYVDNIRWELNPTCPDVVNISVADITTAGATINWEAGGSEASWNVAVGGINVTDPSTLSFVSSTIASKEIVGLADNTSYNVWVRSVCAGNDNGVWIGPVVFKTACLPIATFNENFDSVNYQELPGCWSSILRGPNLSDYASVGAYDTSSAHTAPNAVQLYNSSSDNSTDDIILVSPNLSTLSTGTHRIKFYAQYGDNLQVGTLDSNSSTAVFTPFQEVIPTNTLAEYTVDFTSYSGTDHYVGIRLNTTDTYVSTYIDDIRWEVAPTCPDVTGIMVTGVTTSSATFEWTGGGTESSWNVAVGDATVTDPSTLTFVTSTDITKTVSGLTDATEYKVWVRSACAGNDNGAWIGPITFKTDCLAVANLNENFDSATTPNLPSCWTSILRGPSLSTNAYIRTDTNMVHSGPNSVTLYNSSSSTATDDDIILVSPNLSTLSLGTYRLKFYAKNAGKLQIGTLDSSSGSAVFSPIEEVTTTDETALYKIDFSPYLGTDTHIGIRMSTDNTYTSIYLDDIIWEVSPTCPDVDGIEVVDITTTGANVNWVSNGSETNWQVTYGSSTQTDPNAATNITSNVATLTTTSLSALTDATSYNLWVRSVCSGNDNGAWIGPITFMTLCNATNAPYSEDFETSLNNELPGCTQSLNVGTGNNWNVTNNPGYGFTSKTLTYGYDFDNAADTWFFTRGINLIAGTTYDVSYRYGNNSETQYTESMKVMIGNSPTVDAMVEAFADYPSITGAVPTTELLQYTPATTGVYYFGFNAYSIANQYYLYVDDITVAPSLATGQFDASKFNFYPNPVKNILNISYIKDISAVSVYNLVGQEVLVKNINNKNALIDMSALSSGTYMVKVTADSLVKTVKVIKQ